jgi:hypothetical protein
MAWRVHARELFGRGSLMSFLLILGIIVLVFLAIFWPVA